MNAEHYWDEIDRESKAPRGRPRVNEGGDLEGGRKVREIREAKGITQKELIRLTGIDVFEAELHGCSERDYNKLMKILRSMFYPVLSLDTPELGRKLRESRQSKGLSPSQLMARSGVALDTIKSLEFRPGYKTTAATLGKLCEALGIKHELHS